MASITTSAKINHLDAVVTVTFGATGMARLLSLDTVTEIAKAELANFSTATWAMSDMTDSNESTRLEEGTIELYFEKMSA